MKFFSILFAIYSISAGFVFASETPESEVSETWICKAETKNDLFTEMKIVLLNSNSKARVEFDKKTSPQLLNEAKNQPTKVTTLSSGTMALTDYIATGGHDGINLEIILFEGSDREIDSKATVQYDETIDCRGTFRNRIELNCSVQ